MKFLKYIEETTVAASVEKNLAKGHVDVIGAPKYKKKKKKTRLDRRAIVVHETSVSSAVVGSRQTRVVGDRNDITVLKRQPRPLKFMERVGAYLPPDEEEVIKEDYFEVTVEYAAMDGRARSETWDITDVRNKKQAEKKAHGLFKVEFGKDGYRITKIKREKGNPGVTDKSPSEYEKERKQQKRNRR